MKKILFCLFISFFITGCASYVELSELEVVESLAIDYKNEEYSVFATLIEKDEEIKREVVNGNGKTLQSALKNIKTKKNKKLYIAHLNLLLLTKEAINEKMTEINTFFLENTESRNDFSVAIIDSVDVVFNIDKQKDIAKKIRIVEEDLGRTKSCYFEEFLKDILSRDKGYLPLIQKKEEELITNGIWIIEGKKLSTQLTEEETILFNYLHNSIQKTTYKEISVLSSDTFIRKKQEKLVITIESILLHENEEYSTLLKNDILEMFQRFKEQGIDIFDLVPFLKLSNSNMESVALKNLELEIHVKSQTTAKERGRPSYD